MGAKRQDILLGLIRCGETTWEAERRMAGSTDLPLSEPGRELVVADIDRLRGAELASIYHGPDAAAASTASLLAAPIGADSREFRVERFLHENGREGFGFDIGLFSYSVKWNVSE